MHCLYCDRPLALLKRLTGDGEFCSKEHRKIYQREHSQLALARLLDAQHTGTGNSKARATPVAPAKLEPPAPPAMAVPAGNQPEPAGFISDTMEAVGRSGAVQSPYAPRLNAGSPVRGEAACLNAGRPGPGPKAAVFFKEFPRPGAMDGAIRRQDRSAFRPPERHVQLAERQTAGVGIASNRRPSGAGFLFPQLGASAQRGTALRAGNPRFGPLAQSRGAGAAEVSRNAVDPGVRPAKFVSSLPEGSAGARQTRLPDLAPRWQPLKASLPQREPGKITLVLGSFLQRPVRPAGHDRIPETFEIPFQPVSFPPYPPRMGCLEERLHRTDRIGFSPP
jgi:hypothetical protein